MENEIILKTFEKLLITQRYAKNTVKSYLDYSRLFLNYMYGYTSLKDIPLSEIEVFINEKVEKDRISISYQKSLVGAIKKF